jgi:hypothetical protein
MSHSPISRQALLATFVIGLLLAGCTTGTGHKAVAPTPSGQSSAPSKYALAVAAAAARKLSIWLESDLVSKWRAGRASFDEAIAKLAALGSQDGVVGIKIADELGQEDGLSKQTQVLEFLRDASTAIRNALPGKHVLIDMVVPELGCAPGVAAAATESRACSDDARSRWPGATLAIANAVVSSGYIDVLDLSTGLRDDTYYAPFLLNRDDAQRAAWAEVGRLGWADHVQLQARKALAQDGGYQGDDGQAAADLQTWVDIPLTSGAQAVDVWTWRQPYRGGTAMIMNRGLSANSLWRGLLDRSADRSRLITHFSPSSLEVGLSQDLDHLAQAFGSVFIAAGTG